MKKYVHKGRLPKGQGSSAMAIRVGKLRRARTCQICDLDLSQCLGHQSLVTMPEDFVGRRYGIVSTLRGDPKHVSARVVKAVQDEAIAALKEKEAQA